MARPYREWRLEPQRTTRAFVKWFMVPVGTMILGWMGNSIVLGFHTVEDIKSMQDKVPVLEQKVEAAEKDRAKMRTDVAVVAVQAKEQTEILRNIRGELTEIRLELFRRRR